MCVEYTMEIVRILGANPFRALYIKDEFNRCGCQACVLFLRHLLNERERKWKKNSALNRPPFAQACVRFVSK